MTTLADFERELEGSPALVNMILSAPGQFPVAPRKPKAVVRMGTGSTTLAIVKATALAVKGIEPRIELIDE